jgi:hypothetical protein
MFMKNPDAVVGPGDTIMRPVRFGPGAKYLLATAENGDDYIFMGEIEVNLSASELWETAAALNQ